MQIFKFNHHNQSVKSDCACLLVAGFAQDGETLAAILKNHVSDAKCELMYAGVHADINKMLEEGAQEEAKTASKRAKQRALEQAKAKAAILAKAQEQAQGGVLEGESFEEQGFEAAHLPDIYILSHYAEGISEQIAERGPKCCDFEVKAMDLSALEALVSEYQSIKIVAWSFGVRMARALSAALPSLKDKVVKATAINGTILSVDDLYGIEDKAYLLTYKRFNETMHQMFMKNIASYGDAKKLWGMASLGKELALRCAQDKDNERFNIESLKDDAPRYQCSKDDLKILDESKAKRPVDELKHELRFMPYLSLNESFDTKTGGESSAVSSSLELDSADLIFNEAYICLGDKIIPPVNQENYWQCYKCMMSAHQRDFKVIYVNGAHFCPSLMRDVLIG